MDGVVDVHAHVYVDDYFDLLTHGGVARLGGANLVAGDSDAGLDERIRLMDDAGVALQVLSPTQGPYLEERDSAVGAARLLNDRHLSIVARHPGRFAGFAALPLPDVGAALEEMHRVLDAPGMSGVVLHCSVLGTSIADDRFLPLFEEMERRRSVLFLHPSVNGLASPLVNDWGLAGSVGTIFEDTIIAVQLIAKAIPLRFPNVSIIVPHLGGSLPMILRRLDNQLRRAEGFDMAPSEMARLLWYDTVGHGSAAALRAAADAFGPGRLVSGSDFPVLLPYESYTETMGHPAKAGLHPVDVAAILRGNARQLMQEAG